MNHQPKIYNSKRKVPISLCHVQYLTLINASSYGALPPPPTPSPQFMDASQLDFIYQVNKPYLTIKGCGCRRKEIQLRTVLYQLTAKQRQTAATRCKHHLNTHIRLRWRRVIVLTIA